MSLQPGGRHRAHSPAAVGRFGISQTPQDRRSAAQALVRSLDGLMGPERLLVSMRGTFQAQLEKQLKSASHLTLQQRDSAASVPGATMASTMGE